MENESTELFIELQDNEWSFDYLDHDRQIVRAIVYDNEGFLYFVRVLRDDIFGKAQLIETSGGGVEKNEDQISAIRRELKEELGVEVEVMRKIGVVSDYYNLIHRHNINNYYLCKILSFGDKHMTQDEIVDFHLSTLKLTYDEAIEEYKKCSSTKLGRLISNRELPILQEAKKILVTI
ncbi:MAG: NUDIX hydrolase [Clostridiales bacterium]|nr:NUDIX hydrolase [Clostridiales bacterium]